MEFMNSAIYPKNMGISAMPLVATSFNPFGRLEWQKQCLKSFTSTGHRVISFNHSSEARLIRKEEIEIEICELDEGEVGSKLYGKPLGNIYSVLKKMYAYSAHSHYALVNSDILYAGRKNCMPEILRGLDAAAITRTDISIHEINSSSSGMPYRGGLDIFAFTRQGLAQALATLEEYPQICEAMAFGIPGWDYMMGALVITKINGKIFDGLDLFKHLVHPQSYSELSSFSLVADFLKSASMVNTSNPSHAAAEFNQRINHECQHESSRSTILSLIYSKRAQAAPLTDHSSSANYLTIDEDICIAISQLYSKEKAILIRRKLKQVMKDGIDDFLSLKNTFLFGDSSLLKAQQVLLCASCVFKLLPSLGSLSTQYPEGNSHKACLELIDKNEISEEKYYYLTDLFYTELIQYRIFNANLFCYLVSLQTDLLFARLLESQLNAIQSLLQ